MKSVSRILVKSAVTSNGQKSFQQNVDGFSAAKHYCVYAAHVLCLLYFVCSLC